MGITERKKSEVNGKQTRQSNFELMRLVAMFLIVAYHCVLHSEMKGGMPLVFAPFSGNQVFSFAVGMWGLTGVGCFFLLTAYFQTEKARVRTKRLLFLLLQTVFWAMVTEWVTITKIKGKAFGVAETVNALLSPFIGNYWFIPAYIGVILLSPYMNRIIEGLGENTYRKLMIVFTVISPLYSSLGDTRQTLCDLSIAVYYYLLWGYLKRHPDNWLERHRYGVFFGLALLSVGVAAGSSYFATRTGSEPVGYFTLCGRASFLQVVMAVALFYIFLHMKTGSIGWINIAAKTTLGIYLIHENGVLYPYLWNVVFRIGRYFDGSPYYPAYLLKCVCLTFFGSLAADLLRRCLLEIPLERITKPLDPFFGRIDRWLENTAETPANNS